MNHRDMFLRLVATNCARYLASEYNKYVLNDKESEKGLSAVKLSVLPNI